MCAELLEKAMESEIIAMCVCACVCVCVLHIPIFHHEPSPSQGRPPSQEFPFFTQAKSSDAGPALRRRGGFWMFLVSWRCPEML